MFHVYEAEMHLNVLYMTLMQGGIQWQQTECVCVRVCVSPMVYVDVCLRCVKRLIAVI